MSNFITFLLTLCAIFAFAKSYSTPKVAINLLSPKGIEIKLQDDADIANVQLFAIFSRTVINNSKHLEVDLIKNDNGFWVYENRDIQISKGDTVEYWVFVENGNVGYMVNDLYTVQDLPPPIPECEKSLSTANGKIVCKNTIIFSEEFSSDLKNWNHEERFSSDGKGRDAEFVVYESRPETTVVKENKLTITPKLLTTFAGFDEHRIRTGDYNLGDRCTPSAPTVDSNRECERRGQFGFILPPISSASLITKNKFRFMYGRVQIRAKVPIGDWIYSQFLLQPIANKSSEQIKLFIRANEQLFMPDGQQIGGNLLNGEATTSIAGKTEKWVKTKLLNVLLSQDYHIYELIWEPKLLTLLFDGTVYGTISLDAKELIESRTFDKEYYLSIAVGVGGITAFADGVLNGKSRIPKPFLNTDPRAEYWFYSEKSNWLPTWTAPSLEVDYVRVYSL